MKLINKISLFFIFFIYPNILFGQDAYLGDPDPGSDAPAFNSPNRPSTYYHPNDSRNLEAAYLKKYKGIEVSQNPLNETTKKYFINIYNEELIKFKACVQKESPYRRQSN